MCVVNFGYREAIGVALWVYAKECIEWNFRGTAMGREVDAIYLGSVQTYGRLKYIYLYHGSAVRKKRVNSRARKKVTLCFSNNPPSQALAVYFGICD